MAVIHSTLLGLSEMQAMAATASVRAHALALVRSSRPWKAIRRARCGRYIVAEREVRTAAAKRKKSMIRERRGRKREG